MQKGVTQLAIYKIGEIIYLFGPEFRTFNVNGTIYKVRMNSTRYFLFKKELSKKKLSCVCCGIRGHIFDLDLPKGHKSPHFNLYAKFKNKYLLMTRDHIIPKSKSGENRLKNYQLMCWFCNSVKKDKLISIEDLRKNPAIVQRLAELKKAKNRQNNHRKKKKKNDQRAAERQTTN